MKRILYVIIASCMVGCSSSSPNQPKREANTIRIERGSDESPEVEDPILLLNGNGDTIAPMGKYSWLPESEQGHDLILVMGENGFVYVDANGNELDYQPFIFDNGPDLVSEGMIRIKNKDGKMGYADSLGHLVIEPKYFFVEPWKNNHGKVALEGTKECEGEHYRVVANEWFLIDREGNAMPYKD